MLGETGEAKAAAALADLAEAWPEVMEVLREKLGNGTASLMNGSIPREIKDDTLFIDFPPTGGMQKHMCESNGRADQIAAALSEHLGRTVRIKFGLVAAARAEGAGNPARPTAQKRYEMVSDPAVKIVLVGLDATVTGIEENQ